MNRKLLIALMLLAGATIFSGAVDSPSWRRRI